MTITGIADGPERNNPQHAPSGRRRDRPVRMAACDDDACRTECSGNFIRVGYVMGKSK
jgi:hypothetical protein